MFGLLLASILVGPPTDPGADAAATGAPPEFQTLEGFKSILVAHVNRVLGSERLPAAQGVPVEPGLFVTLTPERMQLFDRNAATLREGRAVDGPAPECKSRCPANLYDAFLDAWLMLAVESRSSRVDLPQRVLLAADARLPARTLLQVAYAAGETRPVAPPLFSIVLNGGPAGVRALPFHLVPPEGLSLPDGVRGLGLTVTLGGQGAVVTAASRSFGRRIQAATPQQLEAILADVRKNFPSKSTVVVVPGEGSTVADLVRTIVLAREHFPRAVLGLGQPLRVD